jgi:hypothetical protein
MIIKRAPGRRRSNKQQGLQVGVRSILCRDLTEATSGEHVQLLPWLLICESGEMFVSRGGDGATYAATLTRRLMIIYRDHAATTGECSPSAYYARQ